eukprot:7552677-Ditylum_brightwellii.AAC.1
MNSATVIQKNTKKEDPIEITIANRTVSKMDNLGSQEKKKVYIKGKYCTSGIRGSQPSVKSFASCFSVTSHKEKQNTNKRCLCQVQSHSAKYI